MNEQIVKRKRMLIMSVFIICAVLVLGGIIAYITCFSETAKYDRYLEIGQKYLLQEEYEKAIVAFKKAIEIDENSIDARFGIADAYIALDKLQKALIYLKEIVEIDINNQKAWEKQIDVCWKLNDVRAINEIIREAGEANIELGEAVETIMPAAPTIAIVKEKEATALEFEADSNCEIYYTIDGSDPYKKEKKYTGPIYGLDGKYVIKAIAVDKLGICSLMVKDEKEIKNDFENLLGRINKRPFDYVGMKFGDIIKEIGPVNYVDYSSGGYLYGNRENNIFIAADAGKIDNMYNYYDDTICTAVWVKIGTVFPDLHGNVTKEELDIVFDEISEKSDYEGNAIYYDKNNLMAIDCYDDWSIDVDCVIRYYNH